MRDGTRGGWSGWYVKSYGKGRFRAGGGEVKGGLRASALGGRAAAAPAARAAAATASGTELGPLGAPRSRGSVRFAIPPLAGSCRRRSAFKCTVRATPLRAAASRGSVFLSPFPGPRAHSLICTRP